MEIEDYVNDGIAILNEIYKSPGTDIEYIAVPFGESCYDSCDVQKHHGEFCNWFPCNNSKIKFSKV